MKLITKEVRQRVNILAHRLALNYECEKKNAILAELTEIAESGAPPAEITRMLKKLESQPPQWGSSQPAEGF